MDHELTSEDVVGGVNNNNCLVHVTLGGLCSRARDVTFTKLDTVSHYAMECHNCESRQRQFYCESCIRAQ